MTDDQQRVIDLSVEVPGTPEEVWEAIATGPGISSWLFPMEVAGHVGGEVTMDFGAYGKETAEVVAYEPPHRIVYAGGRERVLAYEWLVEARAGGTCVVRLVNSGFESGADWDADYDGMTAGWKIFLQNLRLHLTHFRGQRARALVPMGMASGPNAAAFTALCAALGIPDDLRPGDRLRTSGEGVPPLSGTVEASHRQAAVSDYLLLLDAPVPGHAFVVAEGAGEQVMVSMYLYLYGERASASGEALGDPWTPFFAQRFPAPTPEPTSA